jgi:hypothetical protein
MTTEQRKRIEALVANDLTGADLEAIRALLAERDKLADANARMQVLKPGTYYVDFTETPK